MANGGGIWVEGVGASCGGSRPRLGPHARADRRQQTADSRQQTRSPGGTASLKRAPLSRRPANAGPERKRCKHDRPIAGGLPNRDERA